MQKDEEKSVIISLQIPKKIYDSLREEAADKYTSVSHIVRDLLVKHYKEEGHK